MPWGATQTSHNPAWQFVAMLAAFAGTVLVYWPGLAGGFVYDDFPFLVDNASLHITSFERDVWLRAVTSFPAEHQGRWLTMLTFAANHYLSGGLDPFALKLTNLAIHLVNGSLLFFALRALFAVARTEHPNLGSLADARRDNWLALGIASAWLLLPINLTGVLYVAQRLESLSNTFVFLGLWLYFRARRDLPIVENAIVRMGAILVLCTSIGLLAKESAALLPVYAFCAEFALGSMYRTHGKRRPVLTLYGVLLLAPLILGSIWLSSWLGGGTTYERSFTTAQRLMTEARVLVDYVGWCLLPMPKSLSLYHDDIALSTGMLAPPTTLMAILGLFALLCCAFWQRTRRPLFCLGILWFFAGHLLTATIIPLELVYEHRNYFASCGLLLSLGSLLASQHRFLQPRALASVAVAVIAFYAFTTNLRAREWSHPVRFALEEVGNHPRSPQAQYELGRTLAIAIAEKQDSPMTPLAQQAFETCMSLPGTNALCAQGLIYLAARTGQPVEARWWQQLIELLRQRTPTENDVSALLGLLTCQLQDICAHQTMELQEAILAALSHPNPNPRLLGIYAQFAQTLLDDKPLAERMYRELIVRKPSRPEGYENLVVLLLEEGRLDDARKELDALKAHSMLGTNDHTVEALEEMMSRAKIATPAVTASFPLPWTARETDDMTCVAAKTSPSRSAVMQA